VCNELIARLIIILLLKEIRRNLAAIEKTADHCCQNSWQMYSTRTTEKFTRQRKNSAASSIFSQNLILMSISTILAELLKGKGRLNQWIERTIVLAKKI
jgi:hypothetical protein